MAEKLGNEQMVSVEELLLSQSYEIAALVSVLESKGILTSKEVVDAIKELRQSK